MRQVTVKSSFKEDEARENMMEALRKVKEKVGLSNYKIAQQSGMTRAGVGYSLEKASDINLSTFLRLVTGLRCKIIIQIPDAAKEDKEALEYYRTSCDRRTGERDNLVCDLRKRGVRIENNTVYLTPNDNVSVRRIARILKVGLHIEMQQVEE